MKRMCMCSSAALVLVAVFLTDPVNAAVVRIWDGEDETSSSWHNGNNWSPNSQSLSTVSNHLIVTTGWNPVLLLSLLKFSSEPRWKVIVADQDVITDNGGSITLYSPESVASFGARVFVASQGQASMDILSGANLFDTEGYIGLGANAEGHVAVSGAGSTWANYGELAIGRDGTGTLAVTDGGSTSNSNGWLGYSAGASGNVAVSGAGSTWDNSGYLYAGYSGSGSLTITDGAAVSSGTGGFVGYNPGAAGNVTVSGAGSTWTNSSGYLSAGYSGSGSLTISDGGAVLNIYGNIGFQSDGSGNVTVGGTGSTWANSSTLNVGTYGTGSLTITGGATVSDTTGYVGRFAGSAGEVTLSGASSTWVNDDHVSVGHQGTGTLSITAGGAVSNIRHGLIGWDNGAQGAVTVSGTGSAWSCGSNSLYLGGGAYWNGSAYEYGGTGTGTLEISSGGSVSNAIGYLAYNAGASGEVTVSGAGSSWANSSSLYVGRAGTGYLAINNGGLVSNATGYVGRYAGASGEATVSGSGATWANSGTLYVGQEGTGTLSISDGGSVSNTNAYVGYEANSGGDVTVSGTDSSWNNQLSLYLGRYGTSTLTINDGGAVSVGGSLTMAIAGASSGTVNLQGGSLTAQSIAAGAGTANFNWTAGTLSVTGAGGLTLDGGPLGPVVAINQRKGLSVSANTTVNTGVKLSVAGGTFFTETLNVAGTAQLSAGTISISDTFTINSTGKLEITGQDLVLLSAPTLQGNLVLERSTLSVPSMTVAPGAKFDLSSGNISVDGTFTNQNVVIMGTAGPATIRANFFTNNGILMGQGSIGAAMLNTGSFALSGDSSFTEDVINRPGGKFIISGNSATTFFEDVDNQAGAEIRVCQNCAATYFGNLTGEGIFTGTGTNYIEGNLHPGASPALVKFGGDVVYGAFSSLAIELAGQDLGSEFDALEIAGAAELAGTLEVKLLNDFSPTPGDTFKVIAAAGGISGMFDDALLPDLGPLWDLRVFYDASNVILAVVPALAGDYNANGTVDAADFTVWRNMLGQAGEGLAADGNGDRMITQLDYDVWKAHFGQTAGSGSGASANASVPEPVTLVLLTFAAAGWCLRRGRAT